MCVLYSNLPKCSFMFCSHAYLPHKFYTFSLLRHRPGSFMCWAHLGSSLAMGQSHQWWSSGGPQAGCLLPSLSLLSQPLAQLFCSLGAWGRSGDGLPMYEGWTGGNLWFSGEYALPRRQSYPTFAPELFGLFPQALLEHRLVRVPNLTSASRLCTASHWTQEVGGLDLGERKYFE